MNAFYSCMRAICKLHPDCHGCPCYERGYSCNFDCYDEAQQAFIISKVLERGRKKDIDILAAYNLLCIKME